MYFPKNKIKTNLYTSGGEYTTLGGVPYTGYYYEISTGGTFSGKTPRELDSVQIIKYSSNTSPKIPYSTNETQVSSIAYFPSDADNPIYNNPLYDPEIIRNYLRIKNISIPFPGQDKEGYNPDLNTLLNPRSFFPQPSPKNYQLGVFTRYFVVKYNEESYLEIDKTTFDKIKGQNAKWNFALYQPFSITWTLIGDMSEVQTVNRNMVKLAQKEIRKTQFESFLKGNYLKFYLINPGIILNTGSPYTRYYPTYEVIPKPLPKVYQLGNKPDVSSNPKVPEKQHCGNCVFNLNGNCTKWKAMIKSEYWCKAYKGTYGVGKLLNSPSNSSPLNVDTKSTISSPSSYNPPSLLTPPPLSPSSPPPSSGGGSGY